MTARFSDSGYEMEDKLRHLKATSEKKLIRFADIIIKEFKQISRKHTDQIYFTLGYHDRLRRHKIAEKGDIYNGLYSIGSMQSFGDVQH